MKRCVLLFAITVFIGLTGCANMKILGEAAKAGLEESKDSTNLAVGAHVFVHSSDLKKIQETRFMTISGLPARADVYYVTHPPDTLHRMTDESGQIVLRVLRNTTVGITVVWGKYGQAFRAQLDTDLDYRWNEAEKRYIRQEPAKPY